MDKEAIRKALDAFEDDKYTDAKEIIQGEIEKKRNSFLKDKLELDNDVNPVPEKEDE